MDPSQLERLAILGEECGEVQQMVGKCIRFGIDTIKPSRGTTNAHHLSVEIADVLLSIRIMELAGDIDMDIVEEALEAKIQRMSGRPLFQHPQPSVYWNE